MAENFDHRFAGFTLYKDGENFKVYRYEKDPRLEAVEFWGPSKPHSHSIDGYFLFLTPARLTIGRYVDEKKTTAIAKQIPVIVRKRYTIAKNIVHSVDTDQRALLLIYNTVSPRDRTGSEYPDDSHFPESIKYLH